MKKFFLVVALLTLLAEYGFSQTDTVRRNANSITPFLGNCDTCYTLALVNGVYRRVPANKLIGIFRDSVRLALNGKISSTAAAAEIVNGDIANWNAAYNWGDHNGLYPALTGTFNNPSFIASLALSKITQSGATVGQVAKWNGSAWAPGTDNTGGGGGSSTWGGLTGTLSDQADLQTALNAKAAANHTHVAANITDFNTAVSSVSIFAYHNVTTGTANVTLVANKFNIIRVNYNGPVTITLTSPGGDAEYKVNRETFTNQPDPIIQ